MSELITVELNIKIIINGWKIRYMKGDDKLSFKLIQKYRNVMFSKSCFTVQIYNITAATTCEPQMSLARTYFNNLRLQDLTYRDNKGLKIFFDGILVFLDTSLLLTGGAVMNSSRNNGLVIC
jgi:hypothetical protein